MGTSTGHVSITVLVAVLDTDAVGVLVIDVVADVVADVDDVSSS